jgi:methionyl-tRNA synthetase
MSDTPEKFYLTTPIYYVNARPHIGHAYSTIAADVIARRHRLLGHETFFLTGTDEHGQKVQRSAEKAGIPPQQFADEVSGAFSGLWKRMGITNDDFIRTTEERHKRGVQKLWKELEANGAIYLSSYTGAYCVSDEAFVDQPAGTPCPDCGRPLEIVTEENYFFKLSEYQQPLIDRIESGTLHIQPETTKNEVLSFLRGGLKDLSISRTTFDWGIKVPGNDKHVVYVWLDALANYITALGYGSDDPAEIAKFEKFWPADLHLVGKEITRFHCVYWPAFLLAAGLPLPKAVVANGWLLFEESKMSKSRGNVVRTETILDAFGTLCPPPPPPSPPDAVILSEAKDPCISSAEPTKEQRDLFAADVLRYFLLREIPFGQDGTFSFDALITRYNADLANGYGNLVSRTLTMIDLNFGGVIPDPPKEPLLTELIRNVKGNFLQNTTDTKRMVLQNNRAYKDFAERHEFSIAVSAPIASISGTDRYISDQTPWKLAKEKSKESWQKLSEVLYTTAESIRIITALLYPFMPYATASVWRQLGLGDIEEAARNGELKDLKWGGLKPGTKLGALAPIFPRADKGLAQIMTEMESPAVATPEAATTPTPASTQSATERSVPSVSSALSLPSADAAKPDEPTKPEATPLITIDDFAKVDLRVAQILVAERIPKADKLLRLEVDLGYERRQILAGIAEFYQPEALIGRKVVIVANLAPRKMRGLESQGMVVAASLGDHGRPSLAGFLDEVELGARLK